MSIYIGNKEIKDVYIGTTRAKEIYRGTTKIWPTVDQILEEVLIGGDESQYGILNPDATSVKVASKSGLIGYNALRGFIRLTNDNVLAYGIGGNYAILSPDCETVVQAAKQDAIATSAIYAAEMLDDGRILLAGLSGRYAILAKDGLSISQAYKANVIGSTRINTLCKLANGNIFVGGNMGAYGILSADGSTVIQTTKTDLIGTNTIFSSVSLSDGRVMAVGGTGAYNTLSLDGLSVPNAYKTEAMGTEQINSAGRLRNGNIVLCGYTGNYAIVSADGNSVVKATTVCLSGSSAVRNGVVLSNGNLLLCGDGGKYRVFTPDGLTEVQAERANVIGSNNIFCSILIKPVPPFDPPKGFYLNGTNATANSATGQTAFTPKTFYMKFNAEYNNVGGRVFTVNGVDGGPMVVTQSGITPYIGHTAMTGTLADYAIELNKDYIVVMKHIANNQIAMWLNGTYKVVNLSSATSIFVQNITRFRLGDNYANNRKYKGYIYDLRLSSATITDEQAMALSKGEIAVNTVLNSTNTELIFNEIVGNTIENKGSLVGQYNLTASDIVEVT